MLTSSPAARVSTSSTSCSQGPAPFRRACPSQGCLCPTRTVVLRSALSESSTSARSRRSTLEDDPLRCLRRAARPDQRPHLPEIHWRLRQRLGLPEGEAQGEELRAAPAKDPGLLREDRLLLLGTLAHMHTVGDRLPRTTFKRTGCPHPREWMPPHGTEGSPLTGVGWADPEAARRLSQVCVSRRCRALADRAVGHARSSRWTTCARLRFRPAQALSPSPSGEASC